MGEAAWDDITGEEVDTTKLKTVRALEMHHYDQLEVFDKVEIAECAAETGRATTTTRWIDHDKGTRYGPRWAVRQFETDKGTRYRPRWAARQFNTDGVHQNWLEGNVPTGDAADAGFGSSIGGIPH